MNHAKQTKTAQPPLPMMGTVAEKFYGFVIYLVKCFIFVVKIENLHEVIWFYQLLRMKLASSFDVWISLFKTLKMYPFQLLVAAYYNQTVFYQFLPLCCRLALCHFTGFYTYATMQKITTAKMWANKQKKEIICPSQLWGLSSLA